MAKVKKTYSLDEKVADQIEEYGAALGVSSSAFISLMVAQVGQVLQMSVPKKQKRGSAKSGED